MVTISAIFLGWSSPSLHNHLDVEHERVWYSSMCKGAHGKGDIGGGLIACVCGHNMASVWLGNIKLDLSFGLFFLLLFYFTFDIP